MRKITCVLCLAYHKPETRPDGAFVHEVKNMSDSGESEFVTCADSPSKPQGLRVALHVSG